MRGCRGNLCHDELLLLELHNVGSYFNGPNVLQLFPILVFILLQHHQLSIVQVFGKNCLIHEQDEDLCGKFQGVTTLCINRIQDEAFESIRSKYLDEFGCSHRLQQIMGDQ